MGLVIGTRAFETREEGMMDVDAPAFQPFTQGRRKHLHVPRQHDEVDAAGLDGL